MVPNSGFNVSSVVFNSGTNTVITYTSALAGSYYVYLTRDGATLAGFTKNTGNLTINSATDVVPATQRVYFEAYQ